MTQPIDFTQPIEAVSPDGEVYPVEFVRDDGSGLPIEIRSDDAPPWFRRDGTWSGWHLRNRQPQPSRIPDDVVERMVKLVRDLADAAEKDDPISICNIACEAAALARDLPTDPVDPDLIEARKWRAEIMRNRGFDATASLFEEGKGDDTPALRHYLAGIKRGRGLAANEKG